MYYDESFLEAHHLRFVYRRWTAVPSVTAKGRGKGLVR